MSWLTCCGFSAAFSLGGTGRPSRGLLWGSMAIRLAHLSSSGIRGRDCSSMVPYYSAPRDRSLAEVDARIPPPIA